MEITSLDRTSLQTIAMEASLKEPEQLWRQYFIAGSASLAVSSAGFLLGWTAPVLVILDDPELTPLPEPITTDEGAWIGSLLTLAGLLGPFIGGYLSSTIGRKWSLLSVTLPILIGWILIAVATNVGFIYAGRLFWGVGLGMIFTLLPMYCAEVSTVDARGALGSYLQTFMTFGTLFMYIIGPFITYYEIVYVGVAYLALFTVSFFFMPESPTYHLLKNDRKAAADSLMRLRGRSLEGVQKELDQINADVEASKDNKPGTIADVFRGKNFTAFYIGCALITFQQFSGIHAVLFNMTAIFRAAGSNIEPAYATIIVGAVQFAASMMTQFVVDRLKRRTLLMISSCGSAIALGLLGTYFLLADLESPVVESINFLPLLSLVMFMLAYCWGLGALPFAIIGEIMPIEVKAFFTAFASALGSLTSFLITRFFSVIAEAVGHYVVFWIFAGSCVLSFLFTLFVLPESKGKTFNEIQDMLAGSSSKQDEKA
ncbi:hypothetical protein ABMA27_009606 [Loxostege sticticalis]|uniref:Major facilitator superfamily (MFS) profile domain-containing protein n=1 Tax=Loxostege sticticalis TaxID=481309 RepID=A0ABR3H8X3_LOXSC